MFIARSRRLGLPCVAWMAVVSFSLSGRSQESNVRAADDGVAITVFRGQKPILRYRHGPQSHKPYVDQLFSPRGINVLRDAPPDHAHHHGLMFAVSVDGADFWTEASAQRPGRQRQMELHLKTAAHNDRVSLVSIQQKLRWMTADEAALLEEHRRIEAYVDPTLGATLLTWESRLETAPSRDHVTLGGHHYFGLGMRFIESMDHDGRFANASGQDGRVVRGKERLLEASWCAYAAPAEGKIVTVAVFDHPRNARHPATMFIMPEPFAYMSATLNLWQDPLVVKQGQPLLLRYGVAVWDGELEPARIEKLYDRWKTVIDDDDRGKDSTAITK